MFDDWTAGYRAGRRVFGMGKRLVGMGKAPLPGFQEMPASAEECSARLPDDRVLPHREQRQDEPNPERHPIPTAAPSNTSFGRPLAAHMSRLCMLLCSDCCSARACVLPSKSQLAAKYSRDTGDERRETECTQASSSLEGEDGRTDRQRCDDALEGSCAREPRWLPWRLQCNNQAYAASQPSGRRASTRALVEPQS